MTITCARALADPEEGLWGATPLWILEKIVMLKRRDRVIKLIYLLLIRANDVNEHAIFPTFSLQPPLPFEKILDPRLHEVMKKCFACPKYTTVFSSHA